MTTLRGSETDKWVTHCILRNNKDADFYVPKVTKFREYTQQKLLFVLFDLLRFRNCLNIFYRIT